MREPIPQPAVPDDFIVRHFPVVRKVYDLCDQFSVPENEARLYSYIHVKSIERGAEFEDVPHEESIEVDALKALLGTEEWHNARSRVSGNECTRGVIDAFVGVSDDLKATDHTLCQDHGIEFRLQSELHSRLRFHTDPAYRAAKLRFYRSKIRPSVTPAAV